MGVLEVVELLGEIDLVPSSLIRVVVLVLESAVVGVDVGLDAVPAVLEIILPTVPMLRVVVLFLLGVVVPWV